MLIAVADDNDLDSLLPMHNPHFVRLLEAARVSDCA